jgi:hypothetical protein
MLTQGELSAIPAQVIQNQPLCWCNLSSLIGEGLALVNFACSVLTFIWLTITHSLTMVYLTFFD